VERLPASFGTIAARGFFCIDPVLVAMRLQASKQPSIGNGFPKKMLGEIP
jgi:hypothetical protein